MLRLLSALLLLLVATTFAQEPVPTPPASADAFTEVSIYDPHRSATDDILTAQAEAKRSGKRVLLELGGDWCKWCHLLDRTLAGNPDLLTLRRRHYVTVKINVSNENLNKAALNRFGKIDGYPYLIVLDADGKIVRKQDIGELISGHGSGRGYDLSRGYDLKRFRKFLEKYAPKKS
jgi:thiol:disulfide interchange protein